MAQPNIVPSLFGLTPELYQQQRLADLQAQQVRAGTMAAGPGSMLNPSLAPLYTQAAQQGQVLGEGARAVAGLLGVEDPQLRTIRDITSLRQQYDTSTVEGLRQFAGVLAQRGYSDFAMQAAQRAADLEETQAKTSKSRTEAFAAQSKVMNETKLREEIAALGPSATQEQIIAVAAKYGSPDAVLRTLQSSADRQAAIESRRSLAEEKASEKKAEKEAKLSQGQEMAIGAVDRVINEVKEAKPLVNRFTAGFGGSSLSAIPGTEARDLQAKLTTIKANLGFDRLQQMRDASPTGGALGQVAVQELVALQSTVASLDQAQSPKQLRDALDKIETHYTKWRATVRKAGGQEQPAPAPAPTPGAPQAPIYAINPTTNQRIMSTDGGKTWNPVGGR